MEQVRALAADSAASAGVPRYLELLRTPEFGAAAEMFAAEAACLLRATGLPGVAGDGMADRVLAWPQVLSYSSPSEMPTGREGGLSGALMRGIYVVDGASKLQLVFFDPRAPLDAVEPQESLNDMYRFAPLFVLDYVDMQPVSGSQEGGFAGTLMQGIYVVGGAAGVLRHTPTPGRSGAL
jgi:hypothetical protein